jgi:succinoglycan biosynthesis transport protein ExoP
MRAYPEDEDFIDERERSDRRLSGRLAGGVEEPHLKDYIRVVLMRRWLVVGVSLLVVFATTLTVFLMTPIYRATSVLLIEPTKIQLTNFQDVYDPTLSQFAGNEFARREFMETQFQLLVSQPLMEKTFAQFNFGRMERFRDAKDPIPAFTKLFSVSPVRRTRLVEVSFEWPDPKLATDVVNFLVDAYIEDYRARRLGVTGGGLASLKEKAEELRPKVAEKADALQRFMMEHGTVSLEESQNIVVDRLKDLNRQLTELQNKRIQLQSRIESIGHALASKTPLEDMPEVVDSPSMQHLKVEWIKNQQEIEDLGKRFGQNHPELLAAKARQDAIRDKMELEIRSILTATNLEYQRAKQQEEDILRALNEQQQAVMDLEKLRVEYQILRDAHDSLNKTYKAIIQRIDEIEIANAAGTEQDNIFVITPARVPVKPAKPQRLLAMALSCVLGPMLGVGLAFFLQYLDTTIKTRDEVERAMGLPVLGYVPALREEANGDGRLEGRASYDLLAVERPRSAIAEAFRSLRTALSFSAAAQETKSLLVTSPSPLEGKSLVSINLAVAFAQAGKRVLLVDSDLRKPRLHKTFGLAPTVGLSNLLAGEGVRDLDEAVQETSIENLFVLPCGPRPPNPSELLGTDRMRDLVAEMEEKFDKVIFDTPPTVNVTDSSVLLNFVDGAILVVRGFTTQRELARRAAELLQTGRGRVLGVILNNADTPKGAYGYDGYYYYSSYYYYYGDSDETGKRVRKRRRRSEGRRAGAAAEAAGAAADAAREVGARLSSWLPWAKKKTTAPASDRRPDDEVSPPTDSPA